jgi:hypothetical protein
MGVASIRWHELGRHGGKLTSAVGDVTVTVNGAKRISRGPSTDLKWIRLRRCGAANKRSRRSKARWLASITGVGTIKGQRCGLPPMDRLRSAGPRRRFFDFGGKLVAVRPQHHAVSVGVPAGDPLIAVLRLLARGEQGADKVQERAATDRARGHGTRGSNREGARAACEQGVSPSGQSRDGADNWAGDGVSVNRLAKEVTEGSAKNLGDRRGSIVMHRHGRGL